MTKLKVYANYKIETGEELATVGKVLYDNPIGTSGTVTLSETSANFSYMEIFYFGGGVYNSLKIYSPNGKSIDLTTFEIDSTNYNNLYIWSCKASILNTSITLNQNIYSLINATGKVYTNLPQTKIVRVIGYR